MIHRRPPAFIINRFQRPGVSRGVIVWLFVLGAVFVAAVRWL